MLYLRSLRLSTLLCGSLVLLAGCMMQPTVSMELTINGGEKYEVQFGNKGIVKTEDSIVRIDIAGLVVDAASQKSSNAAEIFFKGKAAPKTIMMEDITDDHPVRLIYDDHPTLNANHAWKQTSSYKDLADERFTWLTVIDNSVRVYRFTVVTDDGESHEYRQATMYASYAKEAIRKAMGSKY